MKTVAVTATQARNKFFDLINAAYYGGQVTVIKKNGQPVATITPPQSASFTDWSTFKKTVLDPTYGVWTHLPEVDNPVRDLWTNRNP